MAAVVKADAAFHRETANASGNMVLEELPQSIRLLLRIGVHRALTDEGRAEDELEEDAAINEALKERDAATVSETMRSHMITASRQLHARFDAAQ